MPSAATEVQRVTLRPADHGAALVNPGMGWTMHFYSNFIEKNPIRIASSQGATMTFLLSVVYLVLLLAAYYFPATMLFTAEMKDLQPDWNMLKIVFLAIVAPSLAIIAVSHAIGIRSLKRDY